MVETSGVTGQAEGIAVGPSCCSQLGAMRPNVLKGFLPSRPKKTASHVNVTEAKKRDLWEARARGVGHRDQSQP